MELVAETTDMEAAEDILSSTYAPVRIHPRGPRRGLRLERAALGPVQFHHVDVAMNFEAEGSPLGMLVFGELTSGLLRQGSDGTDRRYLPGGVFLAAQPGHPYTATVHGAEVQLTVIDPALPGQVTDPAPGRTQAPVRFTGYEAASVQARMQWTATCAYVRGILAAPEASPAPLVAASAARLLVATALATFPNNALSEPTTEDRRDGSSATLHRAVRFIDEYAHQDITIADIAAAAHVTIRAVQLAFHRHLDTTPTRYLRRVRLDHAHRQLLGADPERETVSAVAYRWGFSSSSRFAAYYRTAYGISPSATLRAG